MIAATHSMAAAASCFKHTFTNRQPSRSSRVLRLQALRATATAEHVRYVNEVAMVSGDSKVDLLVKVLIAQGQSLVAPDSRQGLMPLLVPLTSSDAASVTCLLRWPEGHKGMELPVVKMQRNGSSVELVARSAQDYVRRALIEEEQQQGGSGGAVAAAAGVEGAALQEPGAFARSGAPSLNAFLTKSVGMFPDVAEALAMGHLQRGDTMSALITGEWYMRRGQFPEWARPYEFNVWLLNQAGRPEESRDVARMCLTLPWWSLKDGFEAARDTAGLKGDADAVRAALDENEEMANGVRTNAKSEKQERMDAAAHLMNRAATGACTWDDIKPAVAEEYKAAGLADVARFVLASS